MEQFCFYKTRTHASTRIFNNYAPILSPHFDYLSFSLMLASDNTLAKYHWENYILKLVAQKPIHTPTIVWKQINSILIAPKQSKYALDIQINIVSDE